MNAEKNTDKENQGKNEKSERGRGRGNKRVCERHKR